jgi:YVTN family beta-propeller protein
MTVAVTPTLLQITPDGRQLYVATTSNQVLIIDIATRSVVATVPVGNQASANSLQRHGFAGVCRESIF